MDERLQFVARRLAGEAMAASRSETAVKGDHREPRTSGPAP
jgi:hypothetical protein